jgi:hypothetical protein
VEWQTALKILYFRSKVITGKLVAVTTLSEPKLIMAVHNTMANNIARYFSSVS